LFETIEDTSESQFVFVLFGVLVVILICGTMLLSLSRVLYKFANGAKSLEVKYLSFKQLPQDMKAELINAISSIQTESGLAIDQAVLSKLDHSQAREIAELAEDPNAKTPFKPVTSIATSPNYVKRTFPSQPDNILGSPAVF
jgi:hypothetical protein